MVPSFTGKFPPFFQVVLGGPRRGTVSSLVTSIPLRQPCFFLRITSRNGNTDSGILHRNDNQHIDQTAFQRGVKQDSKLKLPLKDTEGQTWTFKYPHRKNFDWNSSQDISNADKVRNFSLRSSFEFSFLVAGSNFYPFTLLSAPESSEKNLC